MKANTQWFWGDTWLVEEFRWESTGEKAAGFQSTSATALYHIWQSPKSIRGRGPRLPGCTVSSPMMTFDLSFSQENAVRLLMGLKGDVKPAACWKPPREQALHETREQAGSLCRDLQVRHRMPGRLWQRSPKTSATTTGGDNPKVGNLFF